jgi:hypothetical protein
MAAHPGDQPDPQPDLEYDLAHEAGREQSTGPAPRDDLADAIEVPTQTTSYDGDLSYDLAHDIPRA